MLRCRAVLLAGVALGASGCASHGLFVVPGAVEVTRESAKRGASVSYYVREPFPAEATISFICDSLAHSGWRPVVGKALERYEHSSLESGWSDLPATHPVAARIWSARWVDARGNEVVYTLSYMSRQAEQGLKPTHVSVAAWSYDKTVAAMRREYLRQTIDRMKRRPMPD